MYAHRAWLEKAIELGPLRVLTPLALHHLSIEGMYDVTVEFFTDVLTNFPAFLIDSDYVLLSAVLSSTSARGYIATLKQGNVSDSDSIMFAKLLFAYGDATVQDLAQKFQDPNLKQIMSYLLDLLSCDAYVGAEDQVCQLCLEFWTTFTEFIIDSIFAVGEQRPPWMENARRYIPEVIRACWSKIQMPPQEVFSTWDSEARDLFKEFRSDVKDILQSSYTLLGVEIFDEFAQLALESLNNHAWLHLEATLFCLNALSDSISDEDCVDKILTSLFGSSMFADMMSIYSVPAATRQTAVSLIINYTTFFERQTTYLPSMLNFLFESLKSPTLANVAAKAIHSSCWACRKPLCPEIAAFLHQYEILLTWEGVECSTKEKVLGAIAAIIQALPSEEEKMGPLNVLLNFVEGDVRTCMSLLKEDQHEDAQAFGVFALRCLVNIGKASQTPDEVVIDLDTNGMQTALWTQGHWAAIQARVIHLMGLVIVPMSNDSQVMEAACQILRTGYKESSPGPFVFPPSVTENLVITSHLKTARLDYVLDTAGALLSRHANRPMTEVNNASLTFLIHILSLISDMNSK